MLNQSLIVLSQKVTIITNAEPYDLRNVIIKHPQTLAIHAGKPIRYHKNPTSYQHSPSDRPCARPIHFRTNVASELTTIARFMCPQSVASAPVVLRPGKNATSAPRSRYRRYSTKNIFCTQNGHNYFIMHSLPRSFWYNCRVVMGPLCTHLNFVIMHILPKNGAIMVLYMHNFSWNCPVMI